MKSAAKLKAEKEARAAKAQIINRLATHLESNTRWGKYMARPSQVRAGARKLFDVLMAIGRQKSRENASTT